jgi:acyl carrier protein
MSEATADRVGRIVADVFGIDAKTVSLETSADDVETWDSFNIAILVLALEAEFQITLSPDEASELSSVRAIVATLAGKGVS